MKMKIADLYVRVSTDEQANSGYSQRHQEEMLRRYCTINNISIRKVIYEDHSAKNFNRPEFQKMLAEYKKRKGIIEALLFLKWDRFSRNAGDSYAMIATLNKLGIEPQAIEQPLDLSIPENKLMLAFFLAAPEVENARRGLNVTHGMRRASKEGRVMGIAPKGYINKTDENGRKYIAQKQPEADIIRWVFEELAGSKWNIIELWQEAKKKGLQCSKSNFYTLIQNPVYCGKVLIPAYGQEESCVVKGLHEPIVSEELFYTAQDILHGRRKPARVWKTVREEFPLRNFLVCPQCGRLITASRSKGRTGYYHYYHCVATCGWRYKAEHIHDTFMQELRKYKPHAGYIMLYKEVILDVYNSQANGFKNEKKQVLKEINEQNGRLTKARELLLTEAIDISDYKAIKTECERKLNLLEIKLASTTPQQDDIEQYIDKALYNLAHLDERYEKADIQTKREIIGSIYPEKIEFSESTYRTSRINEAVSLIYKLDAAFRENKKGQISIKTDLSCQVASTGIEPVSGASETLILSIVLRSLSLVGQSYVFGRYVDSLVG